MAVLLLVASCTEYQTAKPVDVKFTSSAQQGLRGYTPMTVRAFRGQIGQNSEISGIACDVVGSGFTAKVITPATVNMPVYGAASKSVYVKCTHDGETIDVNRNAYNITEDKTISAGASGGLVGVLVMGAAMAGRKDRDSDQYGYQPVNLIFKKGAQSK